jgi:hypothetical protein
MAFSHAINTRWLCLSIAVMGMYRAGSTIYQRPNCASAKDECITKIGSRRGALPAIPIHDRLRADSRIVPGVRIV